MRIATRLRQGHEVGQPWADVVEYVVRAEALGVSTIWSAEAWNHDAVTPLGYLAAKTTRARLGTAIVQVGSRSPALVATTALTLAEMSGNRFVLGLGTSGPQVMEGWHGTSFARPLARLRETVEIVRMVTAGDQLVYGGNEYALPLPGGEGKALRTSLPPRSIPIYLAALGPRSLELTGAVADGWAGTLFVAEESSVYLDPIRRGAMQAGRTIDALDIQVALPAQLTSELRPTLARVKASLAFSVGAMGSPETNFYMRALARAGYATELERVREHWIGGRRKAASDAVPDELALRTSLIGDERALREGLRALHHAGVNTINVNPLGTTVEDKLATLGAVLAAASQLSATK